MILRVAMAALALAALAALPTHVAAQDAEVTTAELARNGYLMGGAGFLAGIFAGPVVEKGIRHVIGRPDTVCRSNCGNIGAVTLAVLGGSTGVAAGVHLTNDSRGSFGKAVLVSLGIGAAGAAATMVVDRNIGYSDEPNVARQLVMMTVFLLVIPAAQIASSIEIERSTSDVRGSGIMVPLFSVAVP